MTTTVYLCGSASRARGGWAWVRGSERASGGEANVTSPRMELQAAIEALEALPERHAVHLVGGSEVLAQTARVWIHEWREAGWKKKGGIANLDLVQRLARALETRETTWGPSANEPEIQTARELATAARSAVIAPEIPEEKLVVGPAVKPSAAEILVYTDGGCRGNPGIGGWGALMVHVATAQARSMRGGAPETTNNRMEMMGAIKALQNLQREGCVVEIRSDSKYLIDMCTKWMSGWKRKGWTKGDKEPIKNLDLVKQLDELLAKHRVNFSWVKGHSGEPGNEFVDQLTNDAMDDVRKGKSGDFESRGPSPIAVGSV